MNANETADCLAVIQGGYPTLEITVEMGLLWRNAFAADDPERVQAGLIEWINTEEFPPTVAGIRGKMRDLAAAARRAELQASTGSNVTVMRPSPERGRELARVAYENQCRALGREPRPDAFRSEIPTIGMPVEDE